MGFGFGLGLGLGFGFGLGLGLEHVCILAPLTHPLLDRVRLVAHAPRQVVRAVRVHGESIQPGDVEAAIGRRE